MPPAAMQQEPAAELQAATVPTARVCSLAEWPPQEPRVQEVQPEEPAVQRVQLEQQAVLAVSQPEEVAALALQLQEVAAAVAQPSVEVELVKWPAVAEELVMPQSESVAPRSGWEESQPAVKVPAVQRSSRAGSASRHSSHDVSSSHEHVGR